MGSKFGGKAKVYKTAFFLLAIAVVIVGVMLYNGNFSIPGKEGTTGTITAPTGNVAVACPIQPSLTTVGLDAIATSTTATPTSFAYIVNGLYTGTSTPSYAYGDKVTVVGDLTGYLAGKADLTMGCGAQNAQYKLYNYANATVTVKDDPVSSSNTLTNGGGAYNATKISAGTTRNLPMIFQGTALKSTGNILMVVETPASTGANVSNIQMTVNGVSAQNVAVPDGVSASNAGSARKAFIVPAVMNGAQTSGNLQITTTSSGILSGTVLLKFYAQQTFVNADGQIVEGAFDSSSLGNNAVKYQDLYTYNFVVNS